MLLYFSPWDYLYALLLLKSINFQNNFKLIATALIVDFNFIGNFLRITIRELLIWLQQ
jgi:hypothetical protein